MYFNHAFKKSFLAKTPANAFTLVSSGTTADLTAGKIGLFDAKTYAAINPASIPATNTPFILAQGSFFTNDKIGPYHGGYTESIKSKVINPKYINKVFTVAAHSPAAHIVTVGWDLDEGPGFQFECGKTYRMRVDLKGSPALRFLSHNIYNTVDAFSGCCTDDCSATCTGALVDSTCVLLEWKDRITKNPILSQFIQPQVYVSDGGDPVEVFSAWDEERGDENFDSVYSCVTGAGAGDVVAGIKLTVAYEDTKFGNCTFRVTDHYELQPLRILVSITDETGEPCAIKPVGNSSGYVATGQSNLVTEIQEPAQAVGVGETVIRDLILSGRYRQEAFPDGNFTDSLRMREIEVPSELRNLDRTALYKSINILHSVPRLNNPTSTFDNDQYLLTIWCLTGATTTTLTNALQDILDNAGNGLTIENY